MNSPKTKRALSLVSLCTISLSIGISYASAALLIEESFEYSNGALAGNGGTGFSSAWSTGSGTAGTVVDGLTFQGLETSGGAVQVSGTGTTLTALNRTVGVTSTGTEIWGSYLFQSVTTPVSQAGGAGSTWDVRFKHEGGSTNKYRVIPFNGDAASATVGHSGTIYDPTTAAPAIYDGTTYLFVSRLTTMTASTKTLELWIFDTAGFGIAQSAGLTVASLTANVITGGYIVYSNYTSSAMISNGDVLQLANYMGAGTGSYIVDELRYGNTLLDVVPASIPEPSSIALIVSLSAALVIGLRTWKSRSRNQR